jgi:itaconyl-CoA hydratase
MADRERTVRPGWRGRFFEDFAVGDVYEHPLGRTVTETDNIWMTRRSTSTATTPRRPSSAGASSTRRSRSRS